MRSHSWRGELWVAFGVIAVGLFLVTQTVGIEVSPNYARVGPRVFPWIISCVLIALGLALLRDGLAGRWRSAEMDADAAQFRGAPLFWISLGLGLYLVTITHIGFPIATALLFASAARGFGSRRAIVDLALGLVLGLVVYVGFHHGLGLTLPAGILSGILE